MNFREARSHCAAFRFDGSWLPWYELKYYETLVNIGLSKTRALRVRLAKAKRFRLRNSVDVKAMSDSKLVVVGAFTNETSGMMRLYLEMLGEEVLMSPGHSIELLAREDPDLLPLTIDYVDDGLQIHPYRVADPDWHVRFRGKLLRAGHPTILSAHE